MVLKHRFKTKKQPILRPKPSPIKHPAWSDPILIDNVHQYVYSSVMKRKQLEAELKKLGWWFERHGGNHDIWTNGDQQEPVPRHNEINEKLAHSILRKANRTKK